MAAPHLNNPYGAKGRKKEETNEGTGKDEKDEKKGASQPRPKLPCPHSFCNEISDPSYYPKGLPWATGYLKCLPGYCLNKEQWKKRETVEKSKRDKAKKKKRKTKKFVKSLMIDPDDDPAVQSEISFFLRAVIFAGDPFSQDRFFQKYKMKQKEDQLKEETNKPVSAVVSKQESSDSKENMEEPSSDNKKSVAENEINESETIDTVERKSEVVEIKSKEVSVDKPKDKKKSKSTAEVDDNVALTDEKREKSKSKAEIDDKVVHTAEKKEKSKSTAEVDDKVVHTAEKKEKSKSTAEVDDKVVNTDDKKEKSKSKDRKDKSQSKPHETEPQEGSKSIEKIVDESPGEIKDEKVTKKKSKSKDKNEEEITAPIKIKEKSKSKDKKSKDKSIPKSQPNEDIADTQDKLNEESKEQDALPPGEIKEKDN